MIDHETERQYAAQEEEINNLHIVEVPVYGTWALLHTLPCRVDYRTMFGNNLKNTSIMRTREIITTKCGKGISAVGL